jgi:hypothetical protein
MTRIYVLHENDAWVEPLRSAFGDLGLAHREWFLDGGQVALDRLPPEGVFYNRMSASSHTRGHRYAPEATRAVLHWLELHGRRVVNDSRALALEVDKLGQYTALARAGLPFPRSVAAIGGEQALAAARAFGEWPLIVKPNRGGKGLGVQLFRTENDLAAFLAAPGEAAPIDGTWLIQRYIQAPEPFITRMEFIGGRFHYAVRVDTSDGFELCPADACALPADALCPADSPKPAKFQIRSDFASPLVTGTERLLAANGIAVAGVEFVVDAAGQPYIYDINTNTNYNPEAEAAARAENPAFQGGMQRLAAFLSDELAAVRAQAA